MPTAVIEELQLSVSITESVTSAEIVEDKLSATITESVTSAEIVEDKLSVAIHDCTSAAQSALCPAHITATITEQHLNVSLSPDVLKVQITEVIGFQHAGEAASGGDVFVLDVTNAGIVANKVYVADTVPADKVLQSCTTDVDNVFIYFMAEGSGRNYSPTVTVGGVVCTNLTQYADDRRKFYGSVLLSVPATATIDIESSTGQVTSVIIERAGAGPEILTCLIGSYPGSQTAVKAGDTLNISGTVETAATEVRLITAGGFVASSWQPVVAGNFSFTGTVNSASGNQTCTVEARNSIGTIGTQFDSTNSIILDQLSPIIGSMVVDYPGANLAFKNSETGTVTTSVSDFTSLLYGSPHVFQMTPLMKM